MCLGCVDANWTTGPVTWLPVISKVRSAPPPPPFFFVTPYFSSSTIPFVADAQSLIYNRLLLSCQTTDILGHQHGRPLGKRRQGTRQADRGTFELLAHLFVDSFLFFFQSLRESSSADAPLFFFFFFKNSFRLGDRYGHVVNLRATRSRVRILRPHTRVQTCEPIRFWSVPSERRRIVIVAHECFFILFYFSFIFFFL